MFSKFLVISLILSQSENSNNDLELSINVFFTAVLYFFSKLANCMLKYKLIVNPSDLAVRKSFKGPVSQTPYLIQYSSIAPDITCREIHLIDYFKSSKNYNKKIFLYL